MIADSPSSVAVIDVDNHDTELGYNHIIVKNGNNMVAQAVLICRPNSHPFQERKLSIDQPVKIGRSVARARPATNNAIFDCKVLSRNHALLFYESGKIIIAIGIAGERRLRCGKELSFSVRFMPRLHFAQGFRHPISDFRSHLDAGRVGLLWQKAFKQDAKNPANKFYLQDTKSSNGTFVNNQRLSKGSEESVAREVCSGDIVQFGVDVMENSRKVTHGCIVATLKLFLPDGKEAKASPTTSVSSSLVGTQELYQLSQHLQEAIHREQLLETKLATLQRIIAQTKESSETSWKALIEEDRVLTRLELLENQAQTFSKNFGEDKVREEIIKLQNDKDLYQTSAKESLRKALQEKLEAVRKHQDLEASLSNAEEECTHLRKVSESTKKELDVLAERNNTLLKEMDELSLKIDNIDTINKEKTESFEQSEKDRIILEMKLGEMKKNSTSMTAKLECLQHDNDISKEQISALRTLADAHKKGVKEQNENDINDYKTLTKGKFSYYKAIQVGMIIDKIEEEENSDSEYLHKNVTLFFLLKGFLKSAEQELEEMRRQVSHSELELEESRCKVRELQAQISHFEEELVRVQNDNSKTENKSKKIINDKSMENESIQTNGSIHSEESDHESALEAEIARLKELLAESRSKKETADEEIIKYKDELDDAYISAKKSAEEANTLKQQLILSEQEAENKLKNVTRLQEQLSRAELSVKEIKQQIAGLKSRLAIEEESSKSKQKQIDRLLGKLEGEHVALQKSNASLNELNIQLQDEQQSAKQSHNEAELLRGKVKLLQEELASANSCKENKSSEETISLQEECSNLKCKLCEIEEEISKSKAENRKLSTDYKKLEDNYAKMEIMKDRMGKLGPGFWKDEVEKVKKDYEICHSQLEETQDDIIKVKEIFCKNQDEKTECERELRSLKENVNSLMYRTNTVSICAMIPIFILIIAMILAFLPAWSNITATQDKPSPS
ncbi:Sarcolemmal membrane-associated protein [Nymphon striatum]|nr:Sarcolemmal membrane-associated protein [Nymphon striatum]